MGPYQVIASDHFWLTLNPLRRKYTHEQIVEVVLIVKDAIRELEERGDMWMWLSQMTISSCAVFSTMAPT